MDKNDGMFLGRTVAVVEDLSIDEQLYMYKKAAELKECFREKRNLDEFRINDPEFSAYSIFFENSTRTKESFNNAAKFHNLKVNIFDTETSSVNKQESLVDTIKMLFGYSSRSMFIIRSKKEGVCRALEEHIGRYAEKIGYPVPSFLNAGDGKHEHPTQEFLDEFTFLEKKNWDTARIHIALLGDLFHGRTVHSKADGLKIYKNVTVDLIAPEELALPDNYEQRMLGNGFAIRKFESIHEYLSQKGIAPIWYFTRLQLERMGDEILGKAERLREAVIFKKEFIGRLPDGVKFYHPLPRHRIYPVIPNSLDQTALNGWDEQSINGYFTRIILIGMVGGKLGKDFEGRTKKHESYPNDFVQEVKVGRKTKVIDRYKVGIKPVDNGIVIDHIGRGDSIEEIWNLIDKIRRILKLNCRSSHGVFHSDDGKNYKGIISLPDILELNERELKKLAAIAPGCTFNLIENQSVKNKYRLYMPPRIYNFEEISCKNQNCITHPNLFEHVNNEFLKVGDGKFKCKYCEKTYTFREIWD